MNPQTPETDSAESWWLRAAALTSAPTLGRTSKRWRLGASLCGGRFVVNRQLGSGGMGEVFEARDHERGASVALKTIAFADPQRVAAFKQEFRSLQGIHHPNLISLGELFVEDDTWFFSMELLRGADFLRLHVPVRRR